MSNKKNIVMVAKKTTAVAMAATTAISSAAILPQAFAAEDSGVQYVISNNEYMTRLRMNYTPEPELQFSFVEYNEAGDNIFPVGTAEKLIESAKIQVNDGKVYTFEEAGIVLDNPRTHSAFKSNNLEFIKTFAAKEDINVKLIISEDKVVEFKLPNTLTEEERNSFADSEVVEPDEGGSTDPDAGGDVESNSDLVLDEKETFLKDNWGTATLRITFAGTGEGQQSKSVMTPEEEDAFVKDTKIEINGNALGTLKDCGFESKHWPGASAFNSEDLSNLKSVIRAKELKVVLTTKDDKKISFTIANTLTEEQINEIAGKEVVDPVVESVFNTAKASLVKSKQHDTNSMSGPVLKEGAELLTDSEGNGKLVLHFTPTEIMGIMSYATGLTLNDGIKTEFILSEDNSAICIVDLPKIEDASKVFEGHIYSSVMDADVALKVADIQKVGDVKSKLDEKVEEAKNILDKKEFYPESKEALETAISEAKSSKDAISAYINIERALISLVEKKENPFEGSDIFHVQAKDTSIVGSKSLEKYIRIDVDKDGNKVLKAKYNSYLEWNGNIFFKDIKVYDKDGNEIDKTYTLDNQKNGTLTFTLPYIPAAGNFEITLVEGSGRETKSQIIMDYSKIKKGVFRGLLIETIDKYTHYLSDDYFTMLNIDTRKDDFTEASWDNFEKVLAKCDADLKDPNLTQDTIDEDVQLVKDARRNLLYKVKAGHGNNANLGIDALNNPKSYYIGDANKEYPEIVGWSGSKVIFGNSGETYRVLNNGNTTEEGKEVNTGQVLLMAENLRVKKPFTNEKDKIVKWDKSILREYLNNEFLKNNFSDVEKSAIVKSKIKTYDYTDSFSGVIATQNFVETEDYIFAPSAKMLNSQEYGYGSNDSRITDNGYGLRNLIENALGDTIAIEITPKGRVRGGFNLNSNKLETLPSMNLDASKVVMTLQANKEIPEGLKPVEKTEDNIWKLVLADDSNKLEVSKVDIEGEKAKVEYKAENSEGQTLCAMVKEGDKLVSFGKIGEVKADGKVEINLDGFDSKKQNLYIFAMKENKNNTNTASNLAEVDTSAKKVVKEKLENLVEEAKNIDTKIYTDKTVEALNKNIEEADKVLKDENAEQSSVDKAIENLQKSIKDLAIDKNKLEVSYEVPVKMKKYKEDVDSMANNAIKHIAVVTQKGEDSRVEMTFKPMYIGQIKGHLIAMSVDGKPVEVVSRDGENHIETVAFNVKGEPKTILAEVQADAMNEIAGKPSPQKVEIILDWDNKSEGKINEEYIKNLKEDKIKQINAVDFSKKDLSGKTESSIKKAKAKLEKLKEAALKLVEEAKTVDDIQGISVNIKEAKALLKKEDTGGGGGGSSTNDKEEKKYNIAVSMEKYVDGSESMANNAIDHTAKIIEKDGESKVQLVFKPLKFMGLEGHLIGMKVEDKSVKIVNRYSDGHIKTVEFKVKGKPKKVLAEVEVDAMNEINGGKSSPQKVYVVLDWSKKGGSSSGGSSSDSDSEIKNEKKSLLEVLKTDKVLARILKKSDRIAGENRYATSAKISKKFFPKADNIILASGVNSADALVASSFANVKKAPILITNKDNLPTSIENEIKRLESKNITIVGGENSVSKEVEKDLIAKGYKVNRIAGANRYETSTLLAKEYMRINPSKRLAIVNGKKNADALTLSSLAIKQDMPVIMVEDSSKDVNETIKDWGIKKLYAIGGEKSISKEVVKEIKVNNKTRVAGKDRYETALEIAKLSYPRAESIMLASGEVSIDALSAGAAITKAKAPILLLNRRTIDTKLIDELKRKEMDKVYVLGGNETLNLGK